MAEQSNTSMLTLVAGMAEIMQRTPTAEEVESFIFGTEEEKANILGVTIETLRNGFNPRMKINIIPTKTNLIGLRFKESE